MPGSPPTRTAEEGTRPPPSTRSSSPNPELVRGGGVSSVDRSVRVIALPRFAPSDLEAGPADSGTSSDMVFQSPQASQRPDHFVKDAPQAEQVKDFDFAMPSCDLSAFGRQMGNYNGTKYAGCEQIEPPGRFDSGQPNSLDENDIEGDQKDIGHR